MSATATPSTSDVYDSYLRAIRQGDRRRAFEVIDDARDAGRI
jgi:hypothetical protein